MVLAGLGSLVGWFEKPKETVAGVLRKLRKPPERIFFKGHFSVVVSAARPYHGSVSAVVSSARKTTFSFWAKLMSAFDPRALLRLSRVTQAVKAWREKRELVEDEEDEEE